MTIETISSLCLKAVVNAGYNESTIRNYRGVIRRFKKYRYHTQGRFIRLLDSYFITGEFDFTIVKKGKITPTNQNHTIIYKNYQNYLHSLYGNENTIHFYEYGMYCVLQFLNVLNIFDLSKLQSHMVIRYIRETKISRQREVLCELRGVFRFLKREDLLTASRNTCTKDKTNYTYSYRG